MMHLHLFLQHVRLSKLPNGFSCKQKFETSRLKKCFQFPSFRVSFRVTKNANPNVGLHAPTKNAACPFSVFPVFCLGFPTIHSIRLFSRNNKFAFVEFSSSMTRTISSPPPNYYYTPW